MGQNDTNLLRVAFGSQMVGTIECAHFPLADEDRTIFHRSDRGECEIEVGMELVVPGMKERLVVVSFPNSVAIEVRRKVAYDYDLRKAPLVRRTADELAAGSRGVVCVVM